MLPPTMVCRPAPIVPTIDRERTTMPLTTPRLRRMRKPGRSNAVVTCSCFTMPVSYAPVDLDHRLVLLRNRQLQAIAYAIPGGALDRGLDGIAAFHHRPFLPQEQVGARQGGQPRESVADVEGFAQRNSHLAVDAEEIIARR